MANKRVLKKHLKQYYEETYHAHRKLRKLSGIHKPKLNGAWWDKQKRCLCFKYKGCRICGEELLESEIENLSNINMICGFCLGSLEHEGF
jgi:hypothetical protein